MSSFNPRASGLWEDLNMNSYHVGNGDADRIERHPSQFAGGTGFDGRTPVRFLSRLDTMISER